MSHLMRDRAAEQERGLRPRLCGDGMDAARIDRDQDAATAAAVDQRISKRRLRWNVSACGALQAKHEFSSVSQNLGTSFAGVVVRDPANSPLQGKPCVLEDVLGARARGRQFRRRNARVVVNTNRHHHCRKKDRHDANVDSASGYLNAREVT